MSDYGAIGSIKSYFHSGTDLWIRKWRIIMTGPGFNSFDLHSESKGRDFRCTFQTQAQEGFTNPATAIITIYNLSDATMKGIVKELDQITLEAGYQDGRYGIIFQGVVKQYTRGHEENMTESYLRIYAAHAELIHRFAVTNSTSAAGSTSEQRMKDIQKDMLLKKDQAYLGYQQSPKEDGKLYRGAVKFGMSVDEMRDEATRANMSWGVHDGQMVLVQGDGYAPGQVIDLNASTGLIGHPEVTDNGISVTSLLNPAARVRGLVKLNNDAINWTGAPGGGPAVYWPSVGTVNVFNMLSTDGLYIIIVKTHEGDTRGNPWYTHMTCIARRPDQATAFAGVNPARAAGF
jgi:hypothetical protein